MRTAAETQFAQLFRTLLKGWSPKDQDQPFLDVPQEKLTVLLIGHLDGEVRNGGFDQWLGNPTGEYALQTRDAVQRVGALEVVELISAALAHFPNQLPPADWKQRRQILKKLTRSQREQLDALDERYYALGDSLAANVLRYWQRQTNDSN